MEMPYLYVSHNFKPNVSFVHNLLPYKIYNGHVIFCLKVEMLEWLQNIEW